MKNFFQSEAAYTEFFNPSTGELWVFGDKPENITEDTPHQFVGVAVAWGDGTENKMSLPVTDHHGQREYQTGFFYIGSPSELVDTVAAEKIAHFYNFNA